MTGENIAGLVLAVLLGVYLVAALLFPVFSSPRPGSGPGL